MKVYVASPGVIIDRAKEVIALAERHGHEVTFNWTLSKAEGGEGEVRPHWRDARAEGRVIADKERQGCLTCDTLIILLPPKEFLARGLGCYIEYGIAAGAGKTLWVVGFEDYSRDSIFYCFEETHFLTPLQLEIALRFAAAHELENESERITARMRIADLYRDQPREVTRG